MTIEQRVSLLEERVDLALTRPEWAAEVEVLKSYIEWKLGRIDAPPPPPRPCATGVPAGAIDALRAELGELRGVVAEAIDLLLQTAASGHLPTSRAAALKRRTEALASAR